MVWWVDPGIGLCGILLRERKMKKGRLVVQVRVPESFEGGVLDVTVASRIPLAVLVSDRKVLSTQWRGGL